MADPGVSAKAAQRGDPCSALVDRTVIAWAPSAKESRSSRSPRPRAARQGSGRLALDLPPRQRIAGPLPHGRHELRRKEVAGAVYHRSAYIIALSNAGAHAANSATRCYSTYLLGHWVRARRPSPSSRPCTTDATAGDVRHHRPRPAGPGRPANVVVFVPNRGARPLKRV